MVVDSVIPYFRQHTLADGFRSTNRTANDWPVCTVTAVVYTTYSTSELQLVQWHSLVGFGQSVQKPCILHSHFRTICKKNGHHYFLYLMDTLYDEIFWSILSTPPMFSLYRAITSGCWMLIFFFSAYDQR